MNHKVTINTSNLKQIEAKDGKVLSFLNLIDVPKHVTRPCTVNVYYNSKVIASVSETNDEIIISMTFYKLPNPDSFYEAVQTFFYFYDCTLESQEILNEGIFKITIERKGGTNDTTS